MKEFLIALAIVFGACAIAQAEIKFIEFVAIKNWPCWVSFIPLLPICIAAAYSAVDRKEE